MKSIELVTALKRDHKIIKKLYKEGMKDKTTLARKKKIHAQMAIVVAAHAKSEEQALYINVEEVEKVQDYAFEGFEEHHIVDRLLKELKTFQEPHVWEAKFSVVCEMLKHHIEDEEEKEFFPKLSRLLSLELRKEMGAEYDRLYKELSRPGARKQQEEPHSMYIPATH